MRDVILAALVLSCTQEGDVGPVVRRGPVEIGVTVTVLGDSTARDWPPVLRALRPDWYVISHAKSGARTQDIAEQWTFNTKPYASDAVVVLGGVNDIAAGLGANNAFHYLNTIYTDAKASGVDVYAILALPSSGAYAVELAALNERIGTVAGITTIDMVDEFEARRAEFYTDATHHNEAGLQRLAEVVADALP